MVGVVLSLSVVALEAQSGRDLYNPFGEDDEDFELNELLNRHFKVSMSIVDEHEDPPELRKDIFWNKAEPELIEQEWSEVNITSQEMGKN